MRVALLMAAIPGIAQTQPCDGTSLQVRRNNSSVQFSDEHRYRDQLRCGNRVPVCDGMGENGEALESTMKYHGFGDDLQPAQYPSFEAGYDIRLIFEIGAGAW